MISNEKALFGCDAILVNVNVQQIPVIGEEDIIIRNPDGKFDNRIRYAQRWHTLGGAN